MSKETQTPADGTTPEVSSGCDGGLCSVRLVLDLRYDATVMHGDDLEAKTWFYEHVLADEEGLLLHSNHIGETLGQVRVLEVLPAT